MTKTQFDYIRFQLAAIVFLIVFSLSSLMMFNMPIPPDLFMILFTVVAGFAFGGAQVWAVLSLMET